MFRALTIILLLAFTAQTFDQGIYYLDYAVDRASYERACVNKLLPEMKCHGKCQLMKKLQEQAKKERQDPPELKQSAKTEMASRHAFEISLPPTINAPGQLFHVPVNIGLLTAMSRSVFHPPAYAA